MTGVGRRAWSITPFPLCWSVPGKPTVPERTTEGRATSPGFFPNLAPIPTVGSFSARGSRWPLAPGPNQSCTFDANYANDALRRRGNPESVLPLLLSVTSSSAPGYCIRIIDEAHRPLQFSLTRSAAPFTVGLLPPTARWCCVPCPIRDWDCARRAASRLAPRPGTAMGHGAQQTCNKALASLVPFSPLNTTHLRHRAEMGDAI